VYVVTWTPEDRAWLDQICREHDQLMAEAREEERQRAAEREAAEAERAATENLAQEGAETDAKGSYMQRNASAGLIPTATAEVDPEPDWSGWERWMDGHLNNLRTEIFDTLTEGLGEVIAELRREWERDIERMECRILRHMVGITKDGEVTDRANDGQRADQDAEVIDLPPDWRVRNRVA